MGIKTTVCHHRTGRICDFLLLHTVFLYDLPLQWIHRLLEAMKADRLGAGEILLTSMDCDGTKAGYDLELTRMIAENVSIPVIASGGAGTKEHFYDALTEGKADAALAASLFHYKELEICDLKDYLAERGVSVRR